MVGALATVTPPTTPATAAPARRSTRTSLGLAATPLPSVSTAAPASTTITASTTAPSEATSPLTRIGSRRGHSSVVAAVAGTTASGLAPSRAPPAASGRTARLSRAPAQATSAIRTAMAGTTRTTATAPTPQAVARRRGTPVGLTRMGTSLVSPPSGDTPISP